MPKEFGIRLAFRWSVMASSAASNAPMDPMLLTAENPAGFAQGVDNGGGTESGGQLDWLSLIFGPEVSEIAERNLGNATGSDAAAGGDEGASRENANDANETLPAPVWAVAGITGAWLSLAGITPFGTDPTASSAPACRPETASRDLAESAAATTKISAYSPGGVPEGWAEAADVADVVTENGAASMADGPGRLDAENYRESAGGDAQVPSSPDLVLPGERAETQPAAIHSAPLSNPRTRSAEASAADLEATVAAKSESESADEPGQELSDVAPPGPTPVADSETVSSDVRPTSKPTPRVRTVQSGIRNPATNTDGARRTVGNPMKAVEKGIEEPSNRPPVRTLGSETRSDHLIPVSSGPGEPRACADCHAHVAGALPGPDNLGHGSGAALLSAAPTAGTLTGGAQESGAGTASSPSQSGAAILDRESSAVQGEAVQRRLVLEVEGGGGRRVDIRLQQLPGLVRVNLASPESFLAERMQAELASLHRSLQAAGWEAELGVTLDGRGVGREGWIASPARPPLDASGDSRVSRTVESPAGMDSRADGDQHGNRPAAAELHEEFLDLSAIRRMSRQGGL
ncbi:MAG: hypothetical protein ACP5VC_01335 [Bryobacteraceae bacterium]